MLMTLMTTAAGAQDAPALGLTIGYPAAVGVMWQITDRFAIRPDVTYNWSSTEATSRSTLTFGTGVATQTITTESRSESTNHAVASVLPRW